MDIPQQTALSIALSILFITSASVAPVASASSAVVQGTPSLGSGGVQVQNGNWSEYLSHAEWTPPPIPSGADISSTEYYLMWTLIEEDPSTSLDSIDEDISEDNFLITLGGIVDTPQSTPTDVAVEWNSETHEEFGSTGTGESLHPPSVGTEDEGMIEDAYIDIASVSPSTYVHSSGDEVTHYGPKSGSLIVATDFRVDFPSGTTSENTRVEYDNRTVEESDITISSSGIDITDSTTSESGASRITYREVPDNTPVIRVEKEIDVGVTKTESERVCIERETATPTETSTETTTETTTDEGSPIQLNLDEPEADTAPMPRSAPEPPEPDTGRLQPFQTVQAVTEQAFEALFSSGDDSEPLREVGDCLEYEWQVTNQENLNDSITVTDTVSYEVLDADPSVEYRQISSDSMYLQLSGMEYWTGLTLEGVGYVNGPYDTFTARNKTYDTLVTETEDGSSDPQYADFTPIETHAYPAREKPEGVVTASGNDKEIEVQEVETGPEIAKPELPSGVSLNTSGENGTSVYNPTEKTVVKVAGMDNSFSDETVSFDSVVYEQEFDSLIKWGPDVVPTYIRFDITPIYETSEERRVRSYRITAVLREAFTDAPVSTDDTEAQLMVEGVVTETSNIGEATVLLDADDVGQRITVEYQPAPAFDTPRTHGYTSWSKPTGRYGAGILEVLGYYFWELIWPVFIAFLTVAVTAVLIIKGTGGTLNIERYLP